MLAKDMKRTLFRLLVTGFLLVFGSSSLQAGESLSSKQIQKLAAKLTEQQLWKKKGELSLKDEDEFYAALHNFHHDLPRLSRKDADLLLVALLKATENKDLRKLILFSFFSYIGPKSRAAINKDTGRKYLALGKTFMERIHAAAKLEQQSAQVSAMLDIASRQAPNYERFGETVLTGNNATPGTIRRVIETYLDYCWGKEIGNKGNPLTLKYVIERSKKRDENHVLNFSLSAEDRNIYYRLPMVKGTRIYKAFFRGDEDPGLYTPMNVSRFYGYLGLCAKERALAILKKDGWIGSHKMSAYLMKTVAAMKNEDELRVLVQILHLLITDDFEIPENEQVNDLEIGPKAAQRIRIFMGLVEKHPDPKKAGELLTELQEVIAVLKKEGEAHLPQWRRVLEMVEDPEKRQLIISARRLAKAKNDDAVPFLYEVFTKRTKRSAKAPYAFDPLRQEIFIAITEIGGSQAKAKLRAIVGAYIANGSHTGNRKLPRLNYPYYDGEYAIVVAVGMESLARSADKKAERWFMEIANNKTLHYTLRQQAYHGHFNAQLDRINHKTKGDAARYILNDLTSSGNGEWDYFYHPIKDSDRAGKEGWAIRDTARVRVLVDLGKEALPVLKKAWADLEKKPKLTKAEQRKSYGIAAAINKISLQAKIADHKPLVERPANWEKDWEKELKAHKAKIDAYRKRKPNR